MSLMNDELSMLSRTHYHSFSELIKQGVIPDVHPAGAQVFLFYWVKVFGDGVFAVRFPLAICGILSVLMIYKVASLWFNKITGLFAAATLAILQFPLLYSQLIRMYTMGLFTTLVFTYCWTILFMKEHAQPGSKKLVGVIYILSGVASMYLHYFALMLVGIVGITGLFFISRAGIKNYLLLNVLTVLLFIPHINIFFSQLSQGGVGGPGGWLEVPDGSTFFQYFNNFFNDSWLYIIVILICLISIFLFRRQIKLSKFHLFAILFYLLPFTIGYAYSVLRNPVLQMPGMLFAFPYLLIFLFSFIPGQFNLRTFITTVSYTVLLLFSTLIDKAYYKTYHFGEYKELAELTVAYNNKLGSNNITETANLQNPDYINYYFDKMNTKMDFALYKSSDDASCAQLNEVASSTKTPYFIYAFTNVFNPPQCQQIIQNYFPYLLYEKDMFNSGFYVYSKSKVSGSLSQSTLFEFNQDYEKALFPDDIQFIKNDSNNHFADVTELEYSPGFEKKLNEMNYYPGTTLNTSVKVFSPDTIKDSHLIITIMKNDSAYVWVSASIQNWIADKNEWNTVFTSADIPKELDGTETVKVFVWHRDKSQLLLDDLKVTFTETTDYYRKGIRK